MRLCVLAVITLGLTVSSPFATFFVASRAASPAYRGVRAAIDHAGIPQASLMDVKIGIIDEGFGTAAYNPRLRIIHPSANCLGAEQHGAVVATVLGGDVADRGLGVLPGIGMYAYGIPCQGAAVPDLMSAIQHLVRLHVAVINISLSLGRNDPRLEAAVLNATSQGVIIVAASGNTHSSSLQYPASYAIPGMISVGAIGSDSNVLPSTTVNRRVTAFAPGSAVSIGYVHGRWTIATFSGTSVAAPFVTALVALLKAQDPAATPAHIEERILASTDGYVGRWGSNDLWIKAVDFKGALSTAVGPGREA